MLRCLLPGLLLLVGVAYGQAPMTAIRRDSIPESRTGKIFPPDVHAPYAGSPGRMPAFRPANSFYRYKTDPSNVVRATLDNMPIHIPDSAINYTMLRSFQYNIIPAEPPGFFLKPIPQIVPKK